MANEIVGRHIYYERMHVLLAVAGIARITQATTFQHDQAAVVKIIGPVIDAVQKVVEERIDLFGSAGKARLCPSATGR
jgi:hypothetical protein